MDAGLLLGLAAAVGWALSDILGSKLTKSAGASMPLLFTAAAGVVFYAVSLAFIPVPSFSIAILPLVLFCGAFFTAANVEYFKALREGDVSVVSPITAAFAVPVVLISVLYFHEMLSLPQTCFIVVTIAGTVLVSFRWSELSKRLSSSKPVKGAKAAAFSALSYGIAYSFLKPLSESLGPAGAYLCLLASGLPAYYLFWKRDGARMPTKGLLPLVLGTSLLYTLANLSYASGLKVSLASLVTAISAIHPLFVAMMARVFYNERLEPNQLVGILLVVVGVIGLSI